MPVNSFNTRTGDVTLTSTDVTTALNFIPENMANKNTSGPLTASTTTFPSENVVKAYVDVNTIPTASNNSGFTI